MISLKTILGWLTILAAIVLVSASAFADGDETLGPPSVVLAPGSGYVAAGIGLAQVQPGVININVPAGATVMQVLLYWEGQHQGPFGDDQVTVGGNNVTGTLIGGPNYFYDANGITPTYSSTYRADITGLALVAAGANAVSIDDMDFDFASNGAGLFVIYDEGLPGAAIQLLDGNDLAYKFFSAPRDVMVAQTFTFDAATVNRTANASMFFSSVQGLLSTGGVIRPNEIKITVGATVYTYTDELISNDGQEWDTFSKSILIPAGETAMTIEAFSGPAGDEDPNTPEERPASFAWNAVGMSIPCSGLIGDFVWKDMDCDGTQDAGEPGIPGVTVNLRDCTTNAIIATDVTDANGYYSFEGLCEGCYVVEVDGSTIPAGYTPTTCSNTANVADNSNCSPATVTLTTDTQEDRTIDFGYCAPPECSGKIGNFVWKDNDCDGYQDSGEPGIPNVIVKLLDGNTNAVLKIDTTDANGYYSFDSLCAGCYKVKVESTSLPPGYTATTCSNTSTSGTNSNCSPATVILTNDNSQNLTIDFGYCAPNCCGKIGDRVWKDVDCDGYQDSGEPGIAGVTVKLLNGNTNALIATTTTNSNGYYYFTGLCAGCYIVKVETSTLPSGYTATTCSNSSTSGTNSNCSPATVVLSTNSSINTTIDFGYCPPTPCVPVTFTFCGSTSTCGTAGNIRTFSSNGISVKVSAFSRSKTSATWNTAYLGLYSYGFGVTNTNEGSGGGGSHRVDNIGSNDYVMFEFSTPVKVTKAYLDAVVDDSDISVWYGTFTNPYNNHITLSDAVLAGMTAEQNGTTSSSARWAEFNGGAVTANVLVIAADVMDTSPEDWFKIRKIAITCPTTGAANPGIVEEEEAITAEDLPASYQLMQNFPNPFNPTTQIYFELPEAKSTTLKIFNTLGQEIKTLVDGDLEAGIHTYTWDATDNAGNRVASGVYFYQLRSGEFSAIKKMSLMK